MSWESEQIRIGKVLDGPVKVWENDHKAKENKTHTSHVKVTKSESKKGDKSWGTALEEPGGKSRSDLKCSGICRRV